MSNKFDQLLKNKSCRRKIKPHKPEWRKTRLFKTILGFDTGNPLYKKTGDRASFYLKISGKRGIRTPGPSQVNGFQDRRIRPLCHLSIQNAKLRTFRRLTKFLLTHNKTRIAKQQKVKRLRDSSKNIAKLSVKPNRHWNSNGKSRNRHRCRLASDPDWS